MSSNSGNIVGDMPCPSCRKAGGDSTGNHLMIFADGNKHCNRCGYHESSEGASQLTESAAGMTETRGTPSVFDCPTFKAYPVKAIPHRGITMETCEAYDVRVTLSQVDGQTPEDILIPLSRKDDDTPVGMKTKLKTPFKNKLGKEFKYVAEGDTKGDTFFGYHVAQNALKALPKSYRTLYITEGEMDALALYQTLRDLGRGDKVPPVVSLRNGSKTAARAISDNLDLISQATKVVLAFDSDEAGREASDAAARVLGTKAHVATLPMKDANDMLLADRGKELKKAVLNAEKYMPASLVSASDIMDDILEEPTYGLSYPWPSLTNLSYGIRTGLLIGVAAGTGIGKTDWFTQLAAHLMEEHNEKVGIFFLEAPPQKTYKILAGKMAHTPFHRPDMPYDKEVLRSVINEKVNDNCYAYNHFGYKSWDNIKADIRTLTGYGYKYFMVDPLTALIAQEGDEYKALNRMMEEMASLTQELNITIFYAAHLNQPDRSSKSHEEGGKVKESQLTGSRAMIRWSHYIFGLERNKHAVDETGEPDMIKRNTTRFVLLKDREYGYTGTFSIFYDSNTTDYLEPEVANDDDF